MAEAGVDVRQESGRALLLEEWNDRHRVIFQLLPGMRVISCLLYLVTITELWQPRVVQIALTLGLWR
jgi:hypothetical protein